jgi:hypothetical protein
MPRSTDTEGGPNFDGPVLISDNLPAFEYPGFPGFDPTLAKKISWLCEGFMKAAVAFPCALRYGAGFKNFGLHINKVRQWHTKSQW